MKSSSSFTNNHLLDLARTGRLRLPGSTPQSLRKIADRFYPFLALIFTLAIPFVSAVPSLFILLFLAPILGTSISALAGLSGAVDPLSLAILLVASFAPIILGTWLWVWLCEARSLHSLGLERGEAGHEFIRGLLFGCALIVMSVAGNAAFGYLDLNSSSGDVPVLLRAGSAFFILAAWIVQAAAEEILTRGYLMPVVSIRYGLTAGILVSSIGFMLLHALNSNLSWIALLNLALFGVFAALYALSEGSVWGIIGLHAAWNWAQGSLLGFPVSGSNLSAHSLLALKESGPDWLTGGSFGPEGGLWVTLVLLMAIAYLLRCRRFEMSKIL